MNFDIQEESLKGLGDRIHQAAKKAGGRKRLSEITGISESQLYRYMTETGQPTVGKLVAISMASGLSVQWLATGQEQRLVSGAGDLSDLAEQHFVLPFYGKEALIDVESEELPEAGQSMAFPKAWIPGRADTDQLILVTIVGDSMEPTLSQGDAALVDRSVAKMAEDGLYAIQINKDIQVKRLQKTPTGKIQVTNDNKAYTSHTLDREEAKASLHIIGFVVWTGRKT